MSYWYSDHRIIVTPDQLWDFAWSAPMRDLAAKLGMSDVGLKKLLASHGVTSPPQGYWNKVRAGKPIPARPKLPPRRPGESDRLRLDSRFSDVMQPAEPMPAEGPFRSGLVPETLEDLRAQELKAIGRVAVPKSLDNPHKGLRPLLAREERRRQKVMANGYHWDSPKFDNPVAKRRLRIFNGIFLGLAKRGHGGGLEDRQGDLEAHAIVGDTFVGLELSILGKHRTVRLSGYMRPDPDLPATTPLMLRIDAAETWRDDEDGKLETKIAAITASIVVAGEAGLRRRLREDVERRELARIAAEKARHEQLAGLNRQRLEDLRKSGELLRQSEEIRLLVARVKEAIIAGTANLDARTVQAWEKWALAEADRIDPVKSGQIDEHLREPELP